MKVFELMQALSKMPAGADVKFERLTLMEEFIKNDTCDDDEGVCFAFNSSIAEVEQTNLGIVMLYGG